MLTMRIIVQDGKSRAERARVPLVAERQRPDLQCVWLVTSAVLAYSVGELATSAAQACSVGELATSAAQACSVGELATSATEQGGLGQGSGARGAGDQLQ